MKVLLIVHPEMDHMEAQVFVGLTQLLGEENVITYPFKKSYYGVSDNTYVLADGKIGMRSPYEAMIPRRGESLTKEAIHEIWDQIDLVIIGTVRTYFF